MSLFNDHVPTLDSLRWLPLSASERGPGGEVAPLPETPAMPLAALALAFTLTQPPAKEAAWEPAPRTVEYAWMSTAAWKSRHDGFLARAKKGGVDLLFLGDSITEGWQGQPLWAARFEPRNAANFGVGGDTTQNVLWRVTHGELDGIKPKAVVLLIGTNNFGLRDDTPEDVVKGVTAVVAELGKRLPGARVLLLGILPRDEKPGTDFRRRITAANAGIARLADGKRVKYLDLGPELLEPDGTLSKHVMPDSLHLSAAGYRVWSAAVAGFLAE